ncbi:MAG: HEAT repeat domain-containing protein [Vulcanimicrobiota bacterium]
MQNKASEKLVQKIHAQSYKLLELAEKKFDIKLDYSEEALTVADWLVTLFFKKHRDHYIKAAVMIGSYLGLVIIENLNGKWLKDLSIAKIGHLKGYAHPMTRAKKRLANGVDDSLVTYYKNLKLTTCQNSDFASNKELLEKYKQKLIEKDWDKVLMERMLDPNEERYIREEAAELLGKITDGRLKESLVDAARDSHNVYFAAITMQNYPIEEAHDSLLENLEETIDPFVRQQILLALGRISKPEAVDILIKYMNDRDELVGHFAALAIGAMKSDLVIDKLMAIMAGLKPGKRTHAITALEILGDKRAVPALIEALFSRDDEIREAAARALQYIPDERAFKPLVYCLKDRSSRIRILSAYALSNIGNDDALSHIKNLLTDEVKNVRLHAQHLMEWLKKGGRPQAKVI